ncbi:MAG: tryptophan--tRNA ligase [Sulfolobales archaeon]
MLLNHISAIPIVEFRIDPWSHVMIKEYEKLFQYFGIRPFNEVVDDLKSVVTPHPLMVRGVIFGHRDFNNIVNALKNREKFAIVTGLMPSGKMHFGHKMLIDQIIYYQRLGAEIFLIVADIEAYSVRRINRKEAIEIALYDYIANYIALGLTKSNLHLYFQSNYHPKYYRLIQMISRKLTLAELRAAYGEDLEVGKIVSVITQIADILHPQLKDFGGFKDVLVPVGPDQDPHLRLTRDVAQRFEGELGLKPPASTYHRFMSGLDGGKMSSSRPESYIALDEDPQSASQKLMKAFTGGRATAEEQRRLGGEPEKCVVYEFYAYHLIPDDSELSKVYYECRSGSILCGECKLRACEMLVKFLLDHLTKREKAIDKVYDYVEVPDF